MIDFLNEYWWLAIILWIGLFVADHYMTVVGAKLHKAYVAQYFVFQNGYELNPRFEKEVAESKWFTRKHVLTLVGSILNLSFFRWFSVPIFEFIIGAYILQWLYIDLSHVSNILYFQDIRKPNTIKGSIETTYWLSQRTSARGNISHAILFSVAALATMRPFFWGGVAGFLLHGLRHLYLANRKFPPASATAPQKTDDL